MSTEPRVAYIMSRFPKITETFVLFEILAVENLGIPVEVFPLLRERQAVTHEQAARVVERAHFHPFISLPILWANLYFLAARPLTYVRMIAEVLSGTWRSFNFFFGALGILPKAVRFAYEMRQLGVTHVHAHFATHPAVAALIIKRLVGIPFSFTAHGSDLHVERRMLRRKVEAAAFAVTISKYNKGVIIDECGEDVRDKVHVVHCGVDPDVFKPRTHSASSTPQEGAPLRLLCVASFEDVKGHRYLIEACGLLRERGVDFRLDLVGEGPRRADIERRIAAAKLMDRVQIHGARPQEAVRNMLVETDVVCLPSVPTRGGKREGIPVVLMEAMACAVPVVSSQLSGIPELVDHGVSGILVEPRDSARLADAMQRVAGDASLRASMGAAGRARIEAHFNLHTNARQLAGMFIEHAHAGSSDLTRAAGSAVQARPRMAERENEIPPASWSPGGDAACST